MKYALAVDCGGSKISCLAVDHSGRLLGIAKTVSDGLLLEEISNLESYEQVVNEVINNLNGKCSAVFCNTGGFPPDGLGQLLRDLTETEKVKVVRESTGELIAANAPLWNFNVAVMAGTGSVAVGVADGTIASVGGWGWVIDDRGSGFSLGRDALRATTAYADERYQISEFIADVLAVIITEGAQRENIRDVLKGLLPKLDRQKVAALAPVVMSHAAKDDLLALESVDNATEHLVELALLAAKRLKLQKIRVAGIGGLFAPDRYFRKNFIDKILAHGMEAVFNGFDLLKGAAVCALIESDIKIAPQIIKNLQGNINA